MKSIILSFTLITLSILSGTGSYLYLSGKYELAGIFLSGILFGIFLMSIKLKVKNSKINSYKRELEKESINADNNIAKVKVLESKIEVLEKALENALKK